MNLLWFSAIPSVWLERIGPLSMLLIGFLVEKKFLSRPATFANVIALNTYFAIRNIENLWLIFYADIGLIVGVIAIIAYALRESLPEIFYAINWAYCSVIVAIIILVV